MPDRAYGHGRRQLIKAVRDQNRVWGLVHAKKAAYLTAVFFVSGHNQGMMKTLFKRYRDKVRIVNTDDGVVLRKENGDLAAGGARFESIDVAYEYIRTSTMITI